jgi:hypothetical protein
MTILFWVLIFCAAYVCLWALAYYFFGVRPVRKDQKDYLKETDRLKKSKNRSAPKENEHCANKQSM